jgi:hypothetical protein
MIEIDMMDVMGVGEKMNKCYNKASSANHVYMS